MTQICCFSKQYLRLFWRFSRARSSVTRKSVCPSLVTWILMTSQGSPRCLRLIAAFHLLILNDTEDVSEAAALLCVWLVLTLYHKDRWLIIEPPAILCVKYSTRDVTLHTKNSLTPRRFERSGYRLQLVGYLFLTTKYIRDLLRRFFYCARCFKDGGF